MTSKSESVGFSWDPTDLRAIFGSFSSRQTGGLTPRLGLDAPQRVVGPHVDKEFGPSTESRLSHLNWSSRLQNVHPSRLYSLLLWSDLLRR